MKISSSSSCFLVVKQFGGRTLFLDSSPAFSSFPARPRLCVFQSHTHGNDEETAQGNAGTLVRPFSNSRRRARSCVSTVAGLKRAAPAVAKNKPRRAHPFPPLIFPASKSEAARFLPGRCLVFYLRDCRKGGKKNGTAGASLYVFTRFVPRGGCGPPVPFGTVTQHGENFRRYFCACNAFSLSILTPN